MARKPEDKRVGKCDGDVPPEWMHDSIGRGLENLTPHDTVWLGDDGSLDEDEAIRKYGFDRIEPFALLLKAIIAAHSDEDRSEERLEVALDMLLGRKRREGRDPEDDYDILLEVAWRYHQKKFRGVENVAVAPLVRASLIAFGQSHPSPELEQNDIRRIRDKFAKNKDALLTRVTHEPDEERRLTFVTLAQVADGLERLGVPVDRKMIRPGWRTDGGNSA